PQNIAYEAAKRVNPLLSKRFLRLMREATFIHGRRTSQIDVILDLATQAGYNAAAFIDEYTTGNAHADFMQDRMLCRRNGITGFPSYLVRNDDTEIIIGGYQNLNTFHTLIKRLSAGRIKPRRIGPSVANMMNFAERYHSIYPVDIEVLFGLDRHQTNLMISQEIASGRLTAEPVGESLRLTPNKIVAEHPRQHSSKAKKEHTEA
ncbi:MAG: DsbA family protein, partial [Alistipes sp.]|nr:DsbA family protein [Alistipes sp.]